MNVTQEVGGAKGAPRKGCRASGGRESRGAAAAAVVEETQRGVGGRTKEKVRSDGCRYHTIPYNTIQIQGGERRGGTGREYMYDGGLILRGHSPASHWECTWLATGKYSNGPIDGM